VTVVCSYYAECVSGMDLRVAQKEAGATQLPPGAKVRGLIDSIFGQLQQVSSATNDLASLRLNWFRVESWLSSGESSVFIDPLKVFAIAC
jgi:hypothetical protein